ncbi:unnamed protein product [Owenia fusiformis]|uniref:Alpha/beta hydrolase fold-5 domain-containing protein n=1 Tax=Owenia fusiformis TaxID=6347 RepID=A0A8S4NSM9_OWEFU|nr:unnamed protein product [Owenia fusiformis]
MPTVLSKYCSKTCTPFTSACSCKLCKGKRLALYTHQIVDILKLNYESEDVKEHRDLIENIVDAVAKKVGDLYPVFKTQHKLPNGSFYQKTKIELPNEFDFLNPFVFSETNGVIAIKRSDVSERGKDVYVNDSLRRVILSEPANEPSSRVGDFKIQLTRNDILYPLHRAISKALTNLQNDDRVIYKGECDIRRSKIELAQNGEVDPRKLKLGEILLDSRIVGPCLTLAVGGPLCVTYVDLTFCLEDKSPDKGYNANSGRDVKFFVLPRHFKTWIPTYYEQRYMELDSHHRNVLMVLKYCFVECGKYQCRSTYNSHVLKTIVLNHCLTCKDATSLGRCFNEVAQHVFRLGIGKDDHETNNSHPCLHFSPTWLESLSSIGYFQSNIITEGDRLRPGDILYTLALTILVEFMKTCPEVVDLLRTKDVLSTCLQLICKYSMRALDIKTDGDEFVIEFNSTIPKENIDGFISKLKDLRQKGSDIADLLSAEPLPYPPYRSDPRNTITITIAGTIQQTKSNDKCTKSKKVMDEDAIGPEEIRCREERARRRDEKFRRRQNTRRWVEENIHQDRNKSLALQNASPHKLWVALTTNYTDNLVNPIELDFAIDDAKEELIEAGMPASTEVFLAGHSLGGVFLKMFVHADTASTAGMILYGAYFSRGELASFPVPTLTLSGDLDGMNRITRMAIQFRELMSYVTDNNSDDGTFRFPTVILRGINHGQYFTGDVPSNLQENDIAPEFDGPTARQIIAEATVAFMIKTLGVPQSRLSDATNKLSQYYQENEIRMKPILDAFALENTNGSSDFSKNAQRVISGLPTENWNRLRVSNAIRDDIQFIRSRPTIEIVENQAVIATYSDVVYPENELDISTINESASRVAIKMKSANDIQEELNDEDLGFNTSVSCQDINKMAYDLARDMSSALALQRFSAMNYTINFVEDDMVDIGPEFILGDLEFSQNGKSLVIRSTALKTSTDIPIREFAGQHYCQTISPARFLEFIYVDGLRDRGNT